MSTKFVVCLISWNGEWETAANAMYSDAMKYVGGESKLLRVSTKIKLESFKERVYALVGLDSTSFDLRMAMQATYGPNKVLGRIAPIEDCNDLEGFIHYCQMNMTDVIPLYVDFIPQTVGRKKVDVVTGNPSKDITHRNSVFVESSCDSTEVVTRPQGKDPIMNSNVESIPGLNDVTKDHLLDVEVTTDEDILDTCNPEDDDDAEVHCVHEHAEELHDAEVPIRRGQARGEGVPETNARADHVPPIYETYDENRKGRKIDPFRRLLEVPDAPVIPIQVTGLKAHDTFSNKLELKDALAEYAILNKFEWKVYRSNKSAFEVKCKHDDKCKWRARAIVMPNSEMFVLRRIDRIDQHTCPRDQILPHNRQAGERVAGTLLRSKFDLEDKVYRPKDIISNFEKEYKINLSYMQAWRARSWASKSQGGNENS